MSAPTTPSPQGENAVGDAAPAAEAPERVHQSESAGFVGPVGVPTPPTPRSRLLAARLRVYHALRETDAMRDYRRRRLHRCAPTYAKES